MIKHTSKLPDDYARLLSEIKERVRSAQLTAFRAVNRELVGLYWDIGRMIVERQKDGSQRDVIVNRFSIHREVAGKTDSRVVGITIQAQRQSGEVLFLGRGIDLSHFSVKICPNSQPDDGSAP